MRALFYLLDGDSNASSRYRALQYFPILSEHGIHAEASRPVANPLYERWMEHGSGGTRDKLPFYSLFLASRLVGVLHASQYDVVVIQRDLFPFGPPILERLLRRVNPHIVYDTDDATYLRPSFTPNTVWQRFRRFDKVTEVVRHARLVTVATEPIAAWVRQHNPRVAIVPMTINTELYDAAYARKKPRAEGAPIVLGWIGTRGGFPYVERLAPVFRQLAEKYPIQVRVVSGAFREISLPGVPLDARPWRPEADLDDVAAFDIGLVPLDDAPFEQAKFPGKLLRYLALGVPSVSSSVGATADIVQEGENGLLAASLDEWRDQLERLILDAGLRSRLVTAGRETVAQRYTIQRQGPLFADVLKQAAA